MSIRAAVVLMIAAAPAAPAQNRWTLEVGHSYSSTRALREPATLTLRIADKLETEVDAGVLLSRPVGRSTHLELGARASTGSARTPANRVYGAIVRAYAAPSDWVMALAGEYEADGGFDVQKTIAAAEFSPLGEAAWCLGIRCPRSRLAWRPWLGVGVGNTLRGASGLLSPEPRTFARAYARAELSWVPRPAMELNAEGTAWWLASGSNGRSALTASLAAPLGKGFSLALKGEIGNPPPRFLYSRSFSLGLGFVRRPN